MKARIQSKTGHKVIHLTRRKAIREKCLICSGWSYREVELCPFADCPLHRFRTGKGKQDHKARSRAIRQYCLWCCAHNRTELEKCPAHDCPLWPYRKWKVERTLETLFLSEKRPYGASFEGDVAEGYT